MFFILPPLTGVFFPEEHGQHEVIWHPENMILVMPKHICAIFRISLHFSFIFLLSPCQFAVFPGD